MEAEQIDKSKENIQPLRQGRASNQLSEALLAQANINLEIQNAMQQKIQDYELALRTYEGDDPLEPWYEYICWVEQYFPKHGKEGNFPKLLQKCLALFKNSEVYKQDPRYVSLWIKYLEMQPESPSEMYQMVYNHDIGVKVAQFYHSWAMEMIKLDDMKRADQVYRMGIEEGAQPLDELEQAHKNFQFMVMRHNMGPGGDTCLAVSEEEALHRPALSYLETSGRRNTVPFERGLPLHQANRGPLQSSLPPAPRKPQTTFSVFKDENNTSDNVKALPTKQPMKSFPSSQVLHLENTVEPAPWTECASHRSSTVAPQLSTPFKVHEDPNAFISTSARKAVPSSVLHIRKASEQPEWSVPLAIFEPPDASQKPMYCKEKVYAGGTEFSLEELRAQRHYKLQREAAKKAEVTLRESKSIIQDKRYAEKESEEPNIHDFKPNQKIMFSKLYISDPEVSMEEHKAQSYLRRRKEWENNKKIKEGQEATKISQSIAKEVDPGVPLTYEIPSNCKLCVTYDTLVNGVEHSFEELRATYYQNKQQKAKQMLPEPAWDVPVAVFDPPNPNVKFMYPKHKVYTQNTEYSLEELKAMQYVIRHQLQHPIVGHDMVGISGTSSANSSRGTTPSSTPGHLSMLGQSMTVNTKEAMAAMKDLWCSRVESPNLVESLPKATPFSIFQDTKPQSAPFSIFSTAVVPIDSGSHLFSSVLPAATSGSRRGLQMASEVEEVVKCKEPAEFQIYKEPAGNNWALVPSTRKSTSTDEPENTPYNFNIYQPTTEQTRKSILTPHETVDSKPATRKPFSVISTFDIHQEPAVATEDVQEKDIKNEQPDEVNSKPVSQLANFEIFKEHEPTNVLKHSLGVQMSWGSQVKQGIKEEYQDTVAASQWSVFQDQAGQEESSLPKPIKYEIPYVPPPPDDIDNIDINDDQDVPNKENFSPSNYQPPTESRPLAGILVESKDIPFIPLEDQEKMMQEEEDETELGVRPLPAFVDDVTGLTSHFKQSIFSSSTPYQAPPQSLLGRLTEPENTENAGGSPSNPSMPCAKVVEVAQNEEKKEEEDEIKEEACEPEWAIQNEVETAAAIQARWDQQGMGYCAPRNLSPILEMTGESRGSRSGSSSGSSYVNTISSSYGFSKTPGQFSNTGDSRLAFSKTPGQFSCLGDKTPYHLSALGDSHMSVGRPMRLHLLEMEEDLDMPPPLNMSPPKSDPQMANLNKTVPEVQQTQEPATPSVTAAIEKLTTEVAKLNLVDIDPFCVKLQAELLSNLTLPLKARCGFVEYDFPLPIARVAQSLPLGNKPAKLRRSLGEGAYAKVYKAQVGDQQKVLKLAVDDKTCWDFYISSEIQRRLLNPALSSQFCEITAAYLHSNGTIYEMDFHSNITMLDVVNYYKKQSSAVPMDLVIFFSAEILNLVNTLHSCNIIHADIKPDNFLIQSSSDSDFSAKLQLIDFGRSIDMKFFPQDTTFSTIFKVADFRCVEMRHSKPWTYQLDLYAAAATIHVLLYGKYMNLMENKGKWVPTCKPKRFWDHAQLLHEMFELLLNVESCDQLPDLTPLITSLRTAADKAVFSINKELNLVQEALKE